MVKIDREEIHIKGEKGVLLGELSVFIRALKHDFKIKKKDIKFAVKTGMMSEAEIDEKLAAIYREFIKLYGERFRDDKNA